MECASELREFREAIDQTFVCEVPQLKAGDTDFKVLVDLTLLMLGPWEEGCDKEASKIRRIADEKLSRRSR